MSRLVSKTRAVNCCYAVYWHCGDYFFSVFYFLKLNKVIRTVGEDFIL